jgi:two-component system chemotaxis sensor kinase CheA
LVELVRVGSDSNQGDIEYLQGRPMFRLRGSLLPLVDSRQITGEAINSKVDQGSYIVVLNSEGEHFGLLVPEILDTADIVVKPLSSFLKNLSTFSGATILGDGSIALILDVGGVAHHGKVLNKRAQKDDRELFARNEKKSTTLDVQEFLLFSTGSTSVHAVPLCLVQRLEEFAIDDIEQSGDQKVVRYRDSLLPLINLKKTLNYAQASDQQPQRLPAIVIQRSGRMFGILVDEIQDVVTIEGQIDDTIRDRAGILGNIIHKEEVVVVIDALGIIERFNGSLNSGSRTQLRLASGANLDPLDEIRARNRELKSRRIRVLYAEDVAFFRRHVSKVLNEAGIDVTTVEDGAKALQELEASQKGQYNLVLSDIEMPNLNGLELAREIRKRDDFKSLPMIALTTRFREKDVNDGRTAGFDLYLEKLNPEKLLEAIATLMGPLQVTTAVSETQKELR